MVPEAASVEAVGDRRVGGLSASMYFLTVLGDFPDFCIGVDSGNSRASKAAFLQRPDAVSGAEHSPGEGLHGNFQLCKPFDRRKIACRMAIPCLNTTR